MNAPLNPELPLPPELQKLVDESVARFEQKWKRWSSMLFDAHDFAKRNGFFEAYRAEVTALVRSALSFGEL